jgi:hypothetical protein
MKYIHSLALVATLAATFSACRPQVVDIKIPDAEPRLVIHANWKIDGNPWLWLWVGRTVSILSDSSLNTNSGSPSFNEEDNYANTDWVDNANVELYENGQLLATLLPNPTTHTYRFNFPLGQRLQANAKYELRVSAQGYAAVTAVQENINTPSAAIYNYEPRAARDINGEPLDVVQVDMPANSSNSRQHFDLIAKVSPRDSTVMNSSEYLFTQSPDPILENSAGRIVYTAQANNLSYRLRLHLPVVDTAIYKLDIEVRNITTDNLKYYKSLIAYYSANNNPFAEPVVLFSNVQSGRGLFSLYARQDLNVIP